MTPRVCAPAAQLAAPLCTGNEMSLGLHQNCKQRLVQNISEHLPEVRVNNRMFLDRKSAIMLILAESILPERGQIKENLIRYIGETPVFDFIYETLSRELSEGQKYDSGSTLISLTEIDDYNDSRAVAERLINEFESLPWAYSLTIKLDNDFGVLLSSTIKDHTFCDFIRLITPTEEFENKYPLQSGIESRDLNLQGGLSLLALYSPLQWDQSAAYLQFNIEGFIGQYGETAPLEETISLLKAFCGIGIALRLLKVNYKYRPTPTKAKFYIHRYNADNWQIQRSHELDSNLSDTFNDLVFHDLDGTLNSEESKIGWIKRAFDGIGCVFKNKDKAQKIILASEWLFDSYCGKNELLSFVQTAVVMEILLGEKAISDLMGLGELLRNRCAYLIGKSHKQRQELLEDFKEIYDVRSKIVHRGKSRLTLHEKTLFSKLQWMCRRVIYEEIELLKEDLKA